MLIVCEPLCTRFSHEKVNSGFLQALRLAFPAETIRLYAEATHVDALEAILRHDGVVIPDLEFVAMDFRAAGGLRAMAANFRSFRRLFAESVDAGADKILFLSFNTVLLALLKSMQAIPGFPRLKMVFVLHGAFDTIATDHRESQPPPPGLPRAPVIGRLKKLKLNRQFPLTVLRELRTRVARYWSAATAGLLSSLLTMRRVLSWRHSTDIRYIALAPHILEGARRYVDTDWLNIFVVPMPVVLADPLPKPANKHPVFATFGHGDSAMLYQILSRLEAAGGSSLRYEIRVIGMDIRGTEGFSNVSCPSGGAPMARAEMEASAKDVDAFMILYTAERYRLSCSGSIVEALSYMKPVLHFDNDCVNWFNRIDAPIGICSDAIDEFAGNLLAIVRNYPAFIEDADIYRENLVKLREVFSLENSSRCLNECLTWKAA